MIDLSTPLIEAFTREGDEYSVHMFFCGVERRIPIKDLVPEDENILGLRWVRLSDLLHKGVKYRTKSGLMLQKTHHRHLKKLRDLRWNRRNYLEELLSCITVQNQAKSAS